MLDGDRRVRREQVSARHDPAVLEVVERAAAAERRPVSDLVRNIVSDWASGAARVTRGDALPDYRRHACARKRSITESASPRVTQFRSGSSGGPYNRLTTC